MRNSLSSRVFSMAMTAWAAKFCTSAICLSVKGRTSCAIDCDRADHLILLDIGTEEGPCAAEFTVDTRRCRARYLILRWHRRMLTAFLVSQDAANARSRA